MILIEAYERALSSIHTISNASRVYEEFDGDIVFVSAPLSADEVRLFLCINITTYLPLGVSVVVFIYLFRIIPIVCAILQLTLVVGRDPLEYSLYVHTYVCMLALLRNISIDAFRSIN